MVRVLRETNLSFSVRWGLFLHRYPDLHHRKRSEMENLITVVEQQRLVAQSTDHQTRKLVGLTWGLVVLTVLTVSATLVRCPAAVIMA